MKRSHDVRTGPAPLFRFGNALPWLVAAGLLWAGTTHATTTLAAKAAAVRPSPGEAMAGGSFAATPHVLGKPGTPPRASASISPGSARTGSDRPPGSGAAVEMRRSEESVGTPTAASGHEAVIGLPAGRREGAPPSPTLDTASFAIRGLMALLTLPGIFWLTRRARMVNQIAGPGFEVISPSERRLFIPLEERFQALDFVSQIKTAGALRLSANLNKVTLSMRKYGYLMEDKNYRNALLVNRRRVRRTLLKDGDVLDLGDLTLLYRDNRNAKIVRYSSVTPPEGKSQIKFDRLKGPIRKGMPILVAQQTPNRTYYITKNKIFIGRSESNDLIIKSRSVYYRHAKIEQVGGRHKLQDLSVLGNTFVNNRRVEQRYLKEGDEISIESHRFKYLFATKSMWERPQLADASPDEPDQSAENAVAADGGDEAAE